MTPEEIIQENKLANDPNQFVWVLDPEVLPEEKQEIYWDYHNASYNGWLVCGDCIQPDIADLDLEDGAYRFKMDEDGVINRGICFIRAGILDIYHFSHQLIYSSRGDHNFVEGVNLQRGVLTFHCGS